VSVCIFVQEDGWLVDLRNVVLGRFCRVLS
jgi:hypothetical protein